VFKYLTDTDVGHLIFLDPGGELWLICIESKGLEARLNRSTANAWPQGRPCRRCARPTGANADMPKDDTLLRLIHLQMKTKYQCQSSAEVVVSQTCR